MSLVPSALDATLTHSFPHVPGLFVHVAPPSADVQRHSDAGIGEEPKEFPLGKYLARQT